MSGEVLTRVLNGVLFVAILVVALGPAPDEDGGSWHASVFVKVASDLAIIAGAWLFILQVPWILAMPAVAWVPTLALGGWAFSIGLRRRNRRLAAQRDAERLSESRRSELTE